MARPKKQTVDYFPHFAVTGKTIFILENKYGNDGYATWFKLLEVLCQSEGHYFCARNPADWEYLLSKLRLSNETANNIIDTLATVEAIDNNLWYNHRVIWATKLVSNLQFVYDKRHIPAPGKPIFGAETQAMVKFPSQTVTETPQSKVNEMKVKETKGKDISDSNNAKNPDKKSGDEMITGTVDEITKEIKSLPGWSKNGHDDEWVADLLKEFPIITISIIRACRDWHLEKHPRQKHVWKTALRNWLINEEKYGKEKRNVGIRENPANKSAGVFAKLSQQG